MISVTVNDEVKQLGPMTTVAELLVLLQLRTAQVAVEVNQQLVPRAQHTERVLSAGDQVEIVTLVGGG